MKPPSQWRDTIQVLQAQASFQVLFKNLLVIFYNILETWVLIRFSHKASCVYIWGKYWIISCIFNGAWNEHTLPHPFGFAREQHWLWPARFWAERARSAGSAVGVNLCSTTYWPIFGIAGSWDWRNWSVQSAENRLLGPSACKMCIFQR